MLTELLELDHELTSWLADNSNRDRACWDCRWEEREAVREQIAELEESEL